MKMPICWHEGCLVNSKRSADHKRARLVELQAELKRDDEHNAEYEIMIRHARGLGMDGFDRDKFMKKRKINP